MVQSAIISMNNAFFILCAICVVTMTRSHTNRKHHIHTDVILSQHYVDFLLAAFCTYLSVVQIGRITANYRSHDDVCCAPTGLPRHICITSDASDVISAKKNENKMKFALFEHIVILELFALLHVLLLLILIRSINYILPSNKYAATHGTLFQIII